MFTTKELEALNRIIIFTQGFIGDSEEPLLSHLQKKVSELGESMKLVNMEGKHFELGFNPDGTLSEISVCKDK